MERLIDMIRKNKQCLTARAIRELIDQEDRFILKKLFLNLENERVSYKK